MHHPSAANTPQPAPRTPDEVLERYRELRLTVQLREATLLGWQRRSFFALTGVTACLLALTFFPVPRVNPAIPLLIGFAAAVGLIVLLLILQTKVVSIRRLLLFYDTSILRADGTEPHTARTGEQAADGFEPHLYRDDLDVAGPRSLFSLLATVRTGIGERGLTCSLLQPASHAESVGRQQAVRELLPLAGLRERIALLGQTSLHQLSASFFDQWLADPSPRFHPAFRVALAGTALLNAALLLAGLLRLQPWDFVRPNLLAVLAIQAAIALVIRRKVMPLLEGGARLQGQIKLLAEGLALLQTSKFKSPKLITLQHAARTPTGAVTILRRLDRQLTIVEQRGNGLFLLLSLLFALSTQAAIAIAGWKRRHAPAMRVWLEAWAEFEALNALATYAFEHPEDTWPELLPAGTPPLFNARGLGHPLLPGGVRNDIALGGTDGAQFLLISGSNMAGKSTVMRSIGVAAVLAYAGAPVRAESLRLTPFAIGASIALTDSLAEGKSKFMAEVERLAAIVHLSANQPVLFLVDEIFSGTNSLDRRTAAAAVLRQLLANGAIGALSTHDLALTSLATEENGGVNQHMASPNPEDPLGFDYLLKPGVNQHSNALAIIRLLGL
jgi:hypothetical protein